MTDKELLKAIKGDVDHCPFCGSENLDAGDLDPDGVEAVSDVSCEDCGAEWKEGFRLNWVEVVNDPGHPDNSPDPVPGQVP